MLTWQDFPDAPALGHQICAVADIPRDGVLSLSLEGYPVLILGSATGPKAFVNACPHQFLPLDQRSTSVLSTDGKRLMCSNHQAEFDITDGAGTRGFGLGACLALVPTQLQDEFLVVGELIS